MITWNYRVFREKNGDYVIREVFYGEDGAIIGCTTNPVEPFGQTVEELRKSLIDFQEALTHPVLTTADVPQQTMSRQKTMKRHTISSADVRAQLGLAPSKTNKSDIP